MLRSFSHAPLSRRRVLVRVDFNVPIVGQSVGDDFRIRAALPTIRRLLGRGNRVILLSHASDPRQTLKPVARRLTRILGEPVAFIMNPFGGRKDFFPGGIRVALVENLRFWRGEESCSRAFARALARLGDAYVNDAFGAAHRKGASLTILPRLLPSLIGLLFERELRELDRVLLRPRHPLVAVLGGAKIETKLGILRRFERVADRVLVGGAVANVLLRARGVSVGRSSGSAEPITREVRRLAQSPKILLPRDARIRRNRRGRVLIIPLGRLAPGDSVLDVGPRTVAEFRRALAPARTVVWNGPLGLAEEPAFAIATLAIARALSRSRAEVVVGGGDTVAVLDRAGLAGTFRHVSTGGGAMLAYLAGEKLPALEALKKPKAKN
ncbi:MAG: phosphoglycerate kinase [Candidatus Sungbacteria bacterium RIFCSPLOWO2_01_FULL_59_16]|uniref:Phosphoglycerate kinase n=1 Tax=Candidatus Sungbacteria bacterium RIFCSPLOWO2_01_FULL_59_16 TaxID=1802280 RepID=A0A1G2LBJ6_9BACT|nr:MAG: phosphoglycerate kinase [Candidatus Sungbacteria bacterium RIFCSPLOWO2_01_FULL_59_16]